jgi:vancomycin resistance protein YoaR
MNEKLKAPDEKDYVERVEYTNEPRKENEEVTETENEEEQLDPVELKRLYEEEAATRKRILAEKKAMQEKAAALEAQLNEMSKAKKEVELSTMSVEDRYKLLLDEKEKEASTLKQQLEEKLKEFENINRKNKISQISSDITFTPDTDRDLKNLILEKEFGSIDLNDDESITLTKKVIQSKYKNLLLSQTSAKGVGSKTPSDSEKNSAGGLTPEAYLAMSAEARKKISQADRNKLFGQ